MVIAYGYWLSITYQLGYTSPVEEIIFILGRCGMVLTCLDFLTVSKRATRFYIYIYLFFFAGMFNMAMGNPWNPLYMHGLNGKLICK